MHFINITICDAKFFVPWEKWMKGSKMKLKQIEWEKGWRYSWDVCVTTFILNFVAFCPFFFFSVFIYFIFCERAFELCIEIYVRSYNIFLSSPNVVLWKYNHSRAITLHEYTMGHIWYAWKVYFAIDAICQCSFFPTIHCIFIYFVLLWPISSEFWANWNDHDSEIHLDISKWNEWENKRNGFVFINKYYGRNFSLCSRPCTLQSYNGLFFAPLLTDLSMPLRV